MASVEETLQSISVILSLSKDQLCCDEKRQAELILRQAQDDKHLLTSLSA